MSVPSMTPHRMAQSTRDPEMMAVYAPDEDELNDAGERSLGVGALVAALLLIAYEYLRARAVPERPVVTWPAKLVVWLIAAACGVYCIAIWVGVA